MAFQEEPDAAPAHNRSAGMDSSTDGVSALRRATHPRLCSREHYAWRAGMVIRPTRLNAYEFVVVSALRAQQLRAGCVPRLQGQYSAETMAQMEVAEGRVTRADAELPPPQRQCGWQL